MHSVKIPQNFYLQAEESFDFSVCQMLQSFHICDHLLDSLLDVHMFLVLGSQDLGTALRYVSPEISPTC